MSSNPKFVEVTFVFATAYDDDKEVSPNMHLCYIAMNIFNENKYDWRNLDKISKCFMSSFIYKYIEANSGF